MSRQQVDQVIRKLNNLKGEEYGDVQNFGHGQAVRQLNEQAFEDALQLTPSVRSAREAAKTNEARKEGIRTNQVGRQATSDVPVDKPSPNAPLADKIEWFRTQDEDTVAAEISKMSPEEKDALAREVYIGPDG